MTLFDRMAGQTMRLGARALAAGRVEMAATGLEYIPTDGPVLLVARHYHHLLDGVVLLVSIPRPVHILVTLDWAKNQYWVESRKHRPHQQRIWFWEWELIGELETVSK